MQLTSTMKAAFSGFLLFLCAASPAMGQDVFKNLAIEDASIELYNAQKEAIEITIKQRECDDDRAKKKAQFVSEMKFIDSLCANIPIAEVPKAAEANKMVIPAAWSSEKGYFVLRYERLTFIPGCDVPFVADSVDINDFKALKKAENEGKVKIRVVQFSNYTQVDEIPDATPDEATAARLINDIERLLKAYQKELKVSFEDYQKFEAKKQLKSAKEEVNLRTAFLNNCLKKLAS